MRKLTIILVNLIMKDPITKYIKIRDSNKIVTTFGLFKTQRKIQKF